MKYNISILQATRVPCTNEYEVKTINGQTTDFERVNSVIEIVETMFPDVKIIIEVINDNDKEEN